MIYLVVIYFLFGPYISAFLYLFDHVLQVNGFLVYKKLFQVKTDNKLEKYLWNGLALKYFESNFLTAGNQLESHTYMPPWLDVALGIFHIPRADEAGDRQGAAPTGRSVITKAQRWSRGD